MDLSSHHIRVLQALRGATVLRREPGPANPDGHEHWFTLAQLAAEGRITEGCDPYAVAAAAALNRRKLVARRTMHTVPYYAITPDGLLALAAYEADTGMAGIFAAQLDVDQARYDVRAATHRSTLAERALEDAYRKFMETAGATEAGS
jgi:hypothetical protein